MISREMKGLYHVSGSESLSKFDFAVKLANVFNLDANLVQPAVLGDVPLKAPRPKNISLRTDKISRALGIPMPDVDEGLRRFQAVERFRVRETAQGHERVISRAKAQHW